MKTLTKVTLKRICPVIGISLILAGCNTAESADPEPYESANPGWLLSTDSFSQGKLDFDLKDGEEYPELMQFKNKIEPDVAAADLIFDPAITESKSKEMKTPMYCWRWQVSDGDKLACFPAE